MSKQYVYLLKKSNEVTVIAQAKDNRRETALWLAALATAAFVSAVYLFSFFFSFNQERAPA
jgi:hypothetical protein